MANVLKSIYQGTADTVSSGARTVRSAMTPNPARAVYNLGLGIGPLIQNIVERINEKEKKEKKAAKPTERVATEAQQQQAMKQRQQDTKLVTKQLSVMTKLLKNIERLHMVEVAELYGTQKKIKSLNPLTKKAGEEGGPASAGIIGKITTPAKDDEKDKPSFSSLAGTALAVGGIYSLLTLTPDSIKEAAAGFGAKLIHDIGTPLVKGIGDVFAAAWEKDKTATILGGLFLAKITGVLGLATSIAQAGLLAGKAVNATTKAAANLATDMTKPAAGSIPSVVATSAGSASMESVAERAKLLRQQNPTLTPQQAITRARVASEGVGSQLRLNEAKVAANAVSDVARPAAAATSELGTMAKAMKMVKGIGWLGAVGTAAEVGSGAIDYYQAGKEFEQGKITEEEKNAKKGGAAGRTVGSIGGGIAGATWGGNIGTALGAGAGALFGGVGAAPGAMIGRILGTAVGGWLGSRWAGQAGETAGSFVGSAVPTTNEVQGAPAGSISTGQGQQTGPGKVPTGSWQQDKEFLGEVDRLTAKYQLKKEDLLALFASESGPDMMPFAKNPHSSATGLIQFTEDTARGLGTTTDQLRRMTRAEQMKFVEKYFDYWGLPKGATAGDLYTAVFKPAALSSGENVLYSSGSREYALNASALDVDRNGAITRDDLAARLRKHGAVSSGTAAPGGTGFKPTATTNATALSGASGSQSGLTASSFMSEQTLMGDMLAQNQDALNQVLSAMTGQQIKLDVSNIVNNAMTQANQERSGPSSTSRSRSNPTLDNANFVAGK